ncbi:hypothetical protein BCR42DRAFT_397181 [Absidia repens]|uniref:Uncharacterized protein n=1 Tax=Absidia repens TaxID=90262 RepID=A0A1X2I232_9FUNG|nr:hypothetical protein BCR42DRAFT_397181 [Absidia repens]
MDKRQEYPTPPVGHKPSSYDLPSVIVIVCIGLCFCLRKANRLVPNRYSFPLILRSGNDQGNSRGRGRRQRQQDPFDDIDDEESRQGLLNDFSDQDDIDEELNAAKTDNQPNMFVVVDDDDDGNENSNANGSSRSPQFGNSGKKSA